MQNPNPKITVIAATELDADRAAGLLIFSKHTRLKMSPGGLEAFVVKCKEDPDWMLKELDYMSKTIRSSWELLDVTFMVENVSRACAQQMTRTRQASYAMASQRVTDMSEVTCHMPDSVQDKEVYNGILEKSLFNYSGLIGSGEKIEDARGVLPMNVHCNLIAKYNLRTLADLLPARMSYRAQGEYQEVAAQMREALIEMWPWVHLFLRPKNEMAAAAISDLKASLRKHIDEEKVGRAAIHEIMIYLAKLEDLIQGGKV